MQEEMIKCFDNYNINYYLVLELTEPTALNKTGTPGKSKSGSRLHLHGWFEMPTLLSVGHYLLKSQYLLSRHSDVQINCYRAGWIGYCKKQSSIIRQVAKMEHRVPYILKPKMALIRR